MATKTSWRETIDRYMRESRTVSGGCGASSGQKETAAAQTKLFNTLTQQAQAEFGAASSTVSDLMSSFAPIVAAGPTQAGFSAAEDAALKSAAITGTGEAYRSAAQAVKENEAAVGGGNMVLPGGAEIGAETAVANQGAEQTAEALNKIDVANYETGRQNYFAAASGLNAAPGAFSSSNTAGEVATGAGTDVANTENQIAQENNSWVSAVTGALGGLAGGVVSGGMTNLGKGVGFFGQNAPAPNSGGSSSSPDFSGFTYEGP